MKNIHGFSDGELKPMHERNRQPTEEQRVDLHQTPKNEMTQQDQQLGESVRRSDGGEPE